MTTDTIDATKPKAPPAWLQRKPLDAATVARHLEATAADRMDKATRHPDPAVKQAERAVGAMLRKAVDALLLGEPVHPDLIAELRDKAATMRAAAIATTAPGPRDTYVDTMHVYAEAARLLS